MTDEILLIQFAKDLVKFTAFRTLTYFEVNGKHDEINETLRENRPGRHRFL